MIAINLQQKIEVQYLLDIFTESNNRKARAQQVIIITMCNGVCVCSMCIYVCMCAHTQTKACIKIIATLHSGIGCPMQ